MVQSLSVAGACTYPYIGWYTGPYKYLLTAGRLAWYCKSMNWPGCVIMLLTTIVLFPVTGCPWWIHWLKERRASRDAEARSRRDKCPL